MRRPWFVWGMESLLRLYYPRIPVSHRERLPALGPTIVVANHVNGLLDPLVLQVALGKPLRFLGKSTFWNSPLTRFAVESMDGLPAYRAQEADTSKNEATFALCRQHLRGGGWLALFPEGVSHSEPTLQPLKTGAARIALSAEAEADWGLDLKILPVGLLYEEKEVFRTAVGVVVGAPLLVRAYRAQYEADPKAAAHALTDRMAEVLGEVVLQAEDNELLQGILAVADWTAADGGRDQAARDRRALQLAAAARRLAVEDPARLDAVVGMTRRFAAAMNQIGVENPFSVEEPKVGRLLGGLVGLIVLAPFALLGMIFAWVPYRLVRPLSFRLAAGDLDVVGTYKLFLGLGLITPVYFLWALLAGWALHPLAGLLMLFLGPLTGLVALRFDDRWRARKQALRGWWKSTDAEVVAAIREGRRALCKEVEAALRVG